MWGSQLAWRGQGPCSAVPCLCDQGNTTLSPSVLFACLSDLSSSNKVIHELRQLPSPSCLPASGSPWRTRPFLCVLELCWVCRGGSWVKLMSRSWA